MSAWVVVPVLPLDWEILMLSFPGCAGPVERLVVDHVGVLVAELWEPCSCLQVPSRGDLRAYLRVQFPALSPLFSPS